MEPLGCPRVGRGAGPARHARQRAMGVGCPGTARPPAATGRRQQPRGARRRLNSPGRFTGLVASLASEKVRARGGPVTVRAGAGSADRTESTVASGRAEEWQDDVPVQRQPTACEPIEAASREGGDEAAQPPRSARPESAVGRSTRWSFQRAHQWGVLTRGRLSGTDQGGSGRWCVWGQGTPKPLVLRFVTIRRSRT